jgi:RNA polymerase sigma-70 factor (ECF subfamily)
MGALQTSLSSVRPPLSALKLRPSAGRQEPGRIDSCTSKPPNSDATIASRPISDEWALVQKAIAGDSGSQDKLFATHTARLYRTAFAMLRNKEDAQDAVQDGLCSAYTKLRSFQGRSSFSTWLTRIVINSALMSRRRKSVRPEASLDEILDNQAGRLSHRTVDRRPGPEEICSVTEIHGLVEEEVRRLPAELQKVFQLRVVLGLSTKEAIRALGIPESTFKSRILRARHRLTEALQRSLQASHQVVIAIGANRSKEASAT